MICDIMDFVMTAIDNFRLSKLLYMYKSLREQKQSAASLDVQEFEYLFEVYHEKEYGTKYKRQEQKMAKSLISIIKEERK